MGSTEPSWKTRLMAAVRAAERCPKGGRKRTVVVSHQAAAALQGVRPQNSALPEISVDGRALPKLEGVKVHRTALEDRDIQLVDGIPVTNGVRMLIDLAGVLPDTTFVPLLDDTICARVASRRRTYIVDALWDWIPLVMEVEGLRFHTQPAERQRDAERFNRLTDKARVRRFTYRDVMDRPDYVMASLREALDGTPGPQPK